MRFILLLIFVSACELCCAIPFKTPAETHDESVSRKSRKLVSLIAEESHDDTQQNNFENKNAMFDTEPRALRILRSANNAENKKVQVETSTYQSAEAHKMAKDKKAGGKKSSNGKSMTNTKPNTNGKSANNQKAAAPKNSSPKSNGHKNAVQQKTAPTKKPTNNGVGSKKSNNAVGSKSNNSKKQNPPSKSLGSKNSEQNKPSKSKGTNKKFPGKSAQRGIKPRFWYDDYLDEGDDDEFWSQGEYFSEDDPFFDWNMDDEFGDFGFDPYREIYTYEYEYIYSGSKKNRPRHRHDSEESYDSHEEGRWGGRHKGGHSEEDYDDDDDNDEDYDEDGDIFIYKKISKTRPRPIG